MSRISRSFPAPFILLLVSAAAPTTGPAPFGSAACEGTYPGHLQGVCTNDRDCIFWSFTQALVKTDPAGKVLKRVAVGSHHGDLCYHAGKVYVAVNFGKFNDPKGNADSWVYAYDAGDLSLVDRHPTPEVFYGAGGIAWHDGRFVVIGGLPPGIDENYAYEYDEQLHFLKRHVIASGYTLMGIQTAAYADGHWWFGCYGKPQVLLKVDPAFNLVGRYEFDCSLGIVPVGPGTFLVARGAGSKDKGYTGRLMTAEAEERKGLVLRNPPATTKPTAAAVERPTQR